VRQLLKISHHCVALTVQEPKIIKGRDGVLQGFALDELDADTVRPCQIGNAGTRDKFVRFNRKFAPFFPDDIAELSQVTDYLKAKMIRAPLVVTNKVIKRLQGIL
jgi:hypothetical protein